MIFALLIVIASFQERKPGVKTPSAEWVRLQFQPPNSNAKVSSRYTGRFDLKYQLQSRQLRVNHEDGKYVFHQLRYLKEFAVMHRSSTVMISADDKAMIPVGEPGNPVATGARAHNRSIGSSREGEFIG